jgi:hypothetical protein
MNIMQWPIDIGARHEPGAVLTDAELEQAHGQWHDTWPTQPAELDQREGLTHVNTEAASACSGITSKSDDDALGQGAGCFLWPAAVIAAVGAVSFIARLFPN